MLQVRCETSVHSREHIRYIKQNDPQWAYALHILNNNHEFGPINTTVSLLKQITKTSLLLPYEQYYIQSHYYHKKLIPEQNTGENNPLCQLIFNPGITSLRTIHWSVLWHCQLPRPQSHYTLPPTRLLILVAHTKF